MDDKREDEMVPIDVSNKGGGTYEKENVAVCAVTRSSGVTFRVPKTHDMVRSLFDPTLRKSFLELCITFSLIANCWFCYYCNKRFGTKWATGLYLGQYVVWRLTYNLGIGVVLHLQSHHEFLTEFSKRHKLFDGGNNNSLLASFCQFEIASKMPKNYDFSSYPPEFNVWLLFRQFVDLVLMQDFTTYMLYVVLSLPNELSLDLLTTMDWTSARISVGIGMLLFNVWVKLDAHRVVKDYAWYWGDFFFLLQDSNLVFDGVFNISPHPMYSIGYLGYYGVSLITGDYRVLLVSIMGHLLQFLFLKYVETPHIERIYGPDYPQDLERVDDIIIKNSQNYTKPLMSHLWFSNFDPLRPTDFFTVGTAIFSFVSVLVLKPSTKTMFIIALSIKLFTTGINFTILHQQSNDKWFTKLFLRNGYTQLYSFQIWQFIFNFNLTACYVALISQTWTQYKSIENSDFTTVIFGFILIALQMWSNSEILNAISEFGWFYGDFFLTNYIQRPKLASHGIYRYLNNPECVLGIAGAWGTVLITDFCLENIILATVWTLSNYIMVNFVESPHVAKVYGSEMLSRQSGIGKTLSGFAPLKQVSHWLDKLASSMVEILNVDKENREQIEEVVTMALQAATKKLAPNCEFEIICNGKHVHNDFMFTIGDRIEISWKLPTELYDEGDWIGLYKVVETGEDRFKTRVSSQGHWCATNTTYYSKNKSCIRGVLNFNHGKKITNGRVHFTHELSYFERGIYEFRYHSSSGHKVLMMSPPFKLNFPVLDLHSSKSLYDSTMKFLENCHCLNQEGLFDPNSNKRFTERVLQKLFRYSTGADISSDYMKRVNYDMQVITERIFEMKKILDSLQ
ncbi:phosphatidylethanolamine N-methyltransferase Ecym_6204 [Eremothecium cymbalariae DBVPG|uniref:Phosphatidylethanolamine N-methyltransferase n=1 Tax=Eremothecium cymbalariae (strain CBS 270.75 / DBVPG 7215 / KCTC 17166 / NRRL Y-17582) TaxID=931890 RepID=G8JVA8_ERECY|nr:hypothetical protein Ecym_6204 [Eremothecium cymbalariae DBVPG\